MRNRIRSFRQRRGFTLRELANLTQTTPQSVSRLETGNMTLSTDWLQRLAKVLQVHPVELLEGPEKRDIDLVGIFGADGFTRTGNRTHIDIEVSVPDPVALEIEHDCGIYQAGDVLIGGRLYGEDIDRALGQEAIIQLRDGIVMFRRLLSMGAVAQAVGEKYTSDNAQFLLTPVDSRPVEGGANIMTSEHIIWVAPIAMRVSYF